MTSVFELMMIKVQKFVSIILFKKRKLSQNITHRQNNGANEIFMVTKRLKRLRIFSFFSSY